MQKQGLIIEFVRFWRNKGRTVFPKRIFFFRDGLSEGEIIGVALEEIAQIHR